MHHCCAVGEHFNLQFSTQKENDISVLQVSHSATQTGTEDLAELEPQSIQPAQTSSVVTFVLTLNLKN
jgi:hypothetical protein